MKTAYFYDNGVPRLALWNIPASPLFRENEEVVIVNKLACNGMKGSIASVLLGRATCSLQTEPHHYYVRFTGETERRIFSENEIAKTALAEVRA